MYVRSIYNANIKLQEYGYIMLCKDGFTKNRFHVILAEYHTYALTAKDGGRGYATFNLAFLDELVKLDDLNQLRIYLRTALDLDTNRNPENKLVAKTPYSTLRLYLPSIANLILYAKHYQQFQTYSRSSSLKNLLLFR